MKAFDCGRLFVTSADKVLDLVLNGIQTKEIDVRTTHEEADIIVVKQCYGAVSNGCSSVKVISDDTDVFVLLAFFYLKQNLRCLFSWTAATVAKQLWILQQL